MDDVDISFRPTIYGDDLLSLKEKAEFLAKEFFGDAAFELAFLLVTPAGDDSDWAFKAEATIYNRNLA